MSLTHTWDGAPALVYGVMEPLVSISRADMGSGPGEAVPTPPFVPWSSIPTAVEHLDAHRGDKGSADL